MKEPLKWPARKSPLLPLCTALLLAVGCATKAPAGNAEVLAAKVVRLKGAARYLAGTNDWQQLKVGDRVKPGTFIQTADASRVDLALGAGAGQNDVRLWEQTLLGIEKLGVIQTGAGDAPNSQLDLKMGHISGVIKKMSAAAKYEVKFPNGVAAIRATDYELWANGKVKVIAGSVILTDGKGGNTRVVRPEMQKNSPLPQSDRISRRF